MVQLKYKNSNRIFREVEGSTPYLTFPMLESTGIIKHGFSTRQGGVSTGVFESMNLSFHRGDQPELVRENFERIAGAIGFRTEDMVFSAQTHTTNIRIVTEEDKGNGYTRDNAFQEVDGLITNVPNVCLTTFYADCVPLFFVDPVHRVIALSHAGWRGTVAGIGKITVETMNRNYSCNPQDILVGIGPSICPECYEVGEEVIAEFKQTFEPSFWNMIFTENENEKYQLDLWTANMLQLQKAGIHPSNLAITNLCTYCNDTRFFSHRKMGDKRGQMGAFIQLNAEHSH